jgi:hypothetical protein
VYFIQKNSGAVKIGVSSDLESRIKTLQTGNSEQLKIIAKLPFTSRKQAYDFEKFLHKKFEKHKLSGEWFKGKIINLFWPSDADVPDYVKYKFDCSLTDEQRAHMKSMCINIAP